MSSSDRPSLGPTVFTWSRPWKALHCDVALAATEDVPSIGNCVFPPQARSMLGIVRQLALILFMFLVGTDLDLAMVKGRIRAAGASSPSAPSSWVSWPVPGA